MQYDKSSKWLIQHHGDSILRLAKLGPVASWRALQAEVVQPRQLPDGLLEVLFVGDDDRSLFILELATYPEPRLYDQVLRDVTLVYLDRRVLPEVLVIVYHPRGNFRVAGELNQQSKHGLTEWTVRWRVVELWNLPATELLQAQDVGLIPWVPLTNFADPPEVIFRQCQERIEQQAPPTERDNLLAVTQVLASLRYNDPQLLALLGGKHNVLEFPLIQEIVAERTHETILLMLEGRFGSVPPDVAEEVKKVVDEQKLRELARNAGRCLDLESFRAQVRSLDRDPRAGKAVV